jgi:hypothetical protein
MALFGAIVCVSTNEVVEKNLLYYKIPLPLRERIKVRGQSSDFKPFPPPSPPANSWGGEL